MASDNKTLKQTQWDSPPEWLELIQQHHHDGNILCEKSPDNPVHCSCCSGNLHIAASHHNLPCKQCSPKSLQTKHTSQVQQHLSPSEGLSFSCSALTHMRLRDFEPLCSVHTEPIPVPLRQFCQGNEMHQTWTTHPGNAMEEGTHAFQSPVHHGSFHHSSVLHSSTLKHFLLFQLQVPPTEDTQLKSCGKQKLLVPMQCIFICITNQICFFHSTDSNTKIPKGPLKSKEPGSQCT